jgi:hypothetical protein
LDIFPPSCSSERARLLLLLREHDALTAPFDAQMKNDLGDLRE